MDFYESIVFHYLRADKAIFINTERCIQLNQAFNPDNNGPHWYCDCVATDFRRKAIFLCEISYSKSLGSLTGGKWGWGDGLAGRLKGWHENWPAVCSALTRDSFLPHDWPVQPWVFVPEHLKSRLKKILDRIYGSSARRFSPVINTLEEVQPWLFSSWNRNYESTTAVMEE
jgi:hypothetical protein